MKALYMFVALVLFATASAFAQMSTPDNLFLKNGSIIRGHVEYSSAIMKIRTSDGSLFVYPVTEVEKMVTGSIDSLFLKNGSVIRGQLEYVHPNVKIKTSDGSLFVYPVTDVDKMAKESTEPKEPPTTPVPMVEPSIAQRSTEMQQTPESPSPRKEGVSFGLHGGLFGSLGIWNQLEGDPDSKLGFGLMGTIAAGIEIDDDMFVGAGPHVGGNFWRQSQTIGKFETSTLVNVIDAGGNIIFCL